MSFDGKTVLITGSTSGIGAETARRFAADGASVIVSGRNAERGNLVVKEIEQGGGMARFVEADLKDDASVARLASEAADADVLVNNAASYAVKTTLEQDLESLDEMFAVNVRAPYLLTAAVVPNMIEKGAGSIVNITTMVAYFGMPAMSVYGASKAALHALTRSWAAEFGPSGVRVNSVSPGPTGTDMVLANMPQEQIDWITSTTILGRLGTPAEVANAVIYLSSDLASNVTGTTIHVDGGRNAI